MTTPRNDPNPDVPFAEPPNDDWMVYVTALLSFAAVGLFILGMAS